MCMLICISCNEINCPLAMIDLTYLNLFFCMIKFIIFVDMNTGHLLIDYWVCWRFLFVSSYKAE